MPELPEVETVLTALTDHLLGRTVSRAKIFRPNLRYPFPEGFTETLTQSCITNIYRWSKYLLIELDHQRFWLIHLGMSGQCLIVNQSKTAQKHDHLELDFGEDLRLHYRDPRRFGFMDIIDKPEQHKTFNSLGREAILTQGTYPAAAIMGTIDAQYLSKSLSHKNTTIKQGLFDQHIIAGLGNIYINEILWLIGLAPQTLCRNIPQQLFSPMADAIDIIMKQAVQSGGSSLKDFVHTDGSLGYFQHAWKAYGRTGLACEKSHCSGTITRLQQNNRSSFYCPVHQIAF